MPLAANCYCSCFGVVPIFTSLVLRINKVNRYIKTMVNGIVINLYSGKRYQSATIVMVLVIV